jgi:hypothetical protein
MLSADRESEITHGRVAMLATLGWLVGEAVADNKLFINYDGRITGGYFLSLLSALSWLGIGLQPLVGA